MNAFRLVRWISGIALALLLLPAAAQDYPTKPVRFIVPWPAGGLNDIIARAFNERVSRALGQPVVTEFKAGAAGRIGVADIAKAPPDGYVIGMGNLGPLTIHPNLYKQMPFDAKKDLVPITMFAASPLVLVVATESPIKSAADLVAAAKARPGFYNYASVGLGSPAHLAYEMVLGKQNLKMVHVPFKGTNESLPAMFEGSIHTMFDTLPLLLPQIKAGKLRALAVTTPQRVPQLPDVPTLQELGLLDADVLTWYALIAPAGTPRPVVERLYKEYTAVAQMPEVQKLLAEQGLVYIPNTTAQFQARIAAESARWGKLIADNKIEATQ